VAVAAIVGEGACRGVEVGGLGSKVGALVGVSAAAAVLLGSGVGLGADVPVRLGGGVNVGSRVGLSVAIGTGVFVGVGVTVGRSEPQPVRASATAPARTSKAFIRCSVMLIRHHYPGEHPTHRCNPPWSPVWASEEPCKDGTQEDNAQLAPCAAVRLRS
jgi:hypothetical protein